MTAATARRTFPTGMPLALNPHEVWKFQLVDDRLPDPDGRRTSESKIDPNGTIWTLRAIPASVHAQVADAIHFSGVDEICPNRGTVTRLLLEHGVESVENWVDEKGNTITLRKRKSGAREVVDLEFLDRLVVAHRVELANAIESRVKVPQADGD